MIGGMVGKALDAFTASRQIEAWERKYDELVKGWAADKEVLSAERRVNAQLRQQLDDLKRRDGEDEASHRRRLAADLAEARRASVSASNRYMEEIHGLRAELDAALSAKRIAEASADLARIGAPAALHACRHRENATALAAENARLRALVEALENEGATP